MKIISESEKKVEEILKEIEDHPLSRKFKEEKAAEIFKKRMEAAEKVEAIRKEQAETIPKLQKDLAQSETKFNRAKAAMDAAGVAFNKARAELSSRSLQFENAIGRQREILYSSADSKIDEAIQFFNKKLDYLRSPGRISSQKMGALHNIFTMTKATKEESNLAAVNSAMLFCQSAIRALQEMKLEPVLNTEKIEKMKAAIPPIDVYSEFQGEKPLEKVNADPFSVLPTDSQMEWEKNKLLEKAKKILKR